MKRLLPTLVLGLIGCTRVSGGSTGVADPVHEPTPDAGGSLEVIADSVVPATDAGVVDEIPGGSDALAGDPGRDDVPSPPGPPPLAVFGVSPDRGPANALTTVTVTGSGFADGAQVLFGASKSPAVFVLSEALLNASAPPHPPGLVDVRVLSADGREAVLPGAFQYESDLALAAVEPSSGPSTGGTPVAIRGAGFAKSPAFLFGGRAAIGVTVVDDALALAVTPPHDPGRVSVIALAAGAQVALQDAFAFTAPGVEPVPSSLRLFAISPASGPPEGGTKVAVVGEGFVPGIAVRVGALPAVAVQVKSPTLITAVTPPGSPGPADVAVRLTGGEVVLPGAFLYDPGVSAVLALEPDTGSWAGGERVRIYGYGLDRVSHVFFGPAPAQVVAVESPVSLVVRAPRSEAMGFAPVVVFGEGAAMGDHPFFYFDPALSGGGTWGGPARGDVNVTVFDGHNGQRLAGAYVIVRPHPPAPADPRYSDAHNPFQGRTDDRGQVTFSADDLRGPVVVTATREGYTAYTLADADARNITVTVSPQAQPENPGLPPSVQLGTCTVRGRVRDFNKYFLKPPWVEGEPYVRCGTTATSLFGGTPDPGPGARVDVQGRFEIATRTGRFAVVCLLAVVDPVLGREVPLRLGIAPGLSCSDPDVPIEGVELGLGVEMDGELWVGLPDLPAAPADLNGPAFLGAWDLGSDGWLEVLKNPDPRGPRRVRFPYQPASFEGPLQGNGYSLYVTASSKTGNGMPYAVVLGMARPPPGTWPMLAEDPAGFIEVPTSLRHAVTAMQALPDGSVLAATSAGAVLRDDGGGFQSWKVHTHRPILALWAVDGETFWASGARGRVWRVRGGEVSEVPTGLAVDLPGLCGWTPDEVVVAGGAFLLRHDGLTFVSDPLPPGVLLSDVLCLEDGTVFAVGASGAVLTGPPGGPFEVSTPVPADLVAAEPDGAGGAWVAGAAGTLVHWTHEGFDVRKAPGEADLRGVLVRGADEVLAFGDSGTIVAVDGAGFTDLSRPDVEVDLLAGALVQGRAVLAGRRVLALPGFLPFPTILEPSEGSAWSGTRLAWSFPGTPRVTHQQFILSDEKGYPFWLGMTGGETREVGLPDLAGLIGYTPVPTGLRRMNLTSVYTPGFNVDAFNSSQLNYYRREAFSVGLAAFQ